MRFITRCIAALLVVVPCLVARGAERPNVLFIAVDDLKPLLGCYGERHIKSPNIDRLAERGTVFLNAHCQQAVCAPSRVSLLTGLGPDATKVWDLKTQFRDHLPNVVTLPQHFKQNGYESVGMGKIYDPRSAGGRDKMDPASWSRPYIQTWSPSDATLSYRDPKIVKRIEEITAKLGKKATWGRLQKEIARPPTDMADVPDNAYFDGAMAEEAVRLMPELAAAGKPFFLAVGFKKPHLPFNAPREYWDLYDRDAIKLAANREMPEGAPAFHFQPGWELRSGYDVPQEGRLPDDLHRLLIHGYYACVSYIDAQVGKLLDGLDASGVGDDTIVVLRGDHGWHLGDHSIWCKHTNYEQATRVPLIVAAPRCGKRGNTSMSPVDFFDIYPTLSELVGLPAPSHLHGKSLVPVMKDGAARVKQAAFSLYPRHYEGGRQVMGYALRDERYRYIEWRLCEKKPGPGNGEIVERELYDYESDPLETRNLATDKERTAVIERMGKLANQYRKAYGAPESGRRTSDQKPPNVILIVADDLSRQLCTFLPEGKGKSLMPNLDRLAAEGVVFQNLHSPSPVCTPSRYAVLTGNYPSRCTHPHFVGQTKQLGQSVVEFNTHLTGEDVTLPKLLKQAGYTTGAVGKNHVVSVDDYKRLPYDTDINDPKVKSVLKANAHKLKAAFMRCGFDYAEGLYFGNPDADGIRALAAHNQEWITAAGLDFIERNKDRPFFLYMATTVPHGPFDAKRSWKSAPGITPLGVLEAVPDVQPPRETLEPRLKDAGITGWNTAPVLWMDDGVGALVQKLEDLGIDDNTIILFVSDHGTEAKGAVYRRGTLTAGLAWRKGGFAVGNQVAAELQLTDFAPTILEWAGAQPDANRFDGRSFASILNGETSKVHNAMYFELGYSRAVVKDGFKYLGVRYPDGVRNMPLQERRKRLEESNAALSARGRPLPTTDPTAPFSHLFLIPGGHDVDQVAIKKFPAYFEPDQLYDLKKDPKEQRNLAGDPAYAKRMEALKAELKRYVETLPGRFREF